MKKPFAECSLTFVNNHLETNEETIYRHHLQRLVGSSKINRSDVLKCSNHLLLLIEVNIDCLLCP